MPVTRGHLRHGIAASLAVLTFFVAWRGLGPGRGPEPLADAILWRGADSVTALAFCPDGRALAFGTAVTSRSVVGAAPRADEIGVLDVAGGTRTAALSGHASSVSALAFSPDGRNLTSASWEVVLRWHLPHGKAVQAWRVPGAVSGRAVQLSPDGALLLAWTPGRQACVYELHAAKPPEGYGGDGDAPPPPGGPPVALSGSLRFRGNVPAGLVAEAFAPDGRMVAGTAGVGRGIGLWDLDRQLVRYLPGPDQVLSAIAFSPDASAIVAGSTEGALRFWNLATGACSAAAGRHEGMVRCLAFSPDGASLASGGEDGTVQLWDASGGTKPVMLGGHDGRVNALAFAPDGRVLASGGSDGAVRLWRTNEAGRYGRSSSTREGEGSQ